jgi:hypothetical protein
MVGAVMTRLDALRAIVDTEPEGCHCEQALQATCDRYAAELVTLRDEVTSLKKSEQDAWTLAEQVLQAATLDEAKLKASIYLGLTPPF